MKRKITIIGVFLLFASLGFSQFEVKVNPIGLLFGGITASGEVILNDNMGAEVSLGLSTFKYSVGLITDEVKLKGFSGQGYYKYYFSPDKGGDKFYADIYLKYSGISGKYDYEYTDPETLETSTKEAKTTYTKAAVGFGAGYKWVADSGLLFDIGFGFGRNLVNKFTDDAVETVDIPWPFDIDGRISIGWRF